MKSGIKLLYKIQARRKYFLQVGFHEVLSFLSAFRKYDTVIWSDFLDFKCEPVHTHVYTHMYDCFCSVKWQIFPLNQIREYLPLVFFLTFYLFIFIERGREGERERNINAWLPLLHHLLGTWPATQACALTGNWTSNSLVDRLALNPLSHNQPELPLVFLKWVHSNQSNGHLQYPYG